MKITRHTFDEVMIPCYKPMNMLMVKAHGSYMYDDQGERYLDLTAGIAVNCLGHTPNGVQRIIKKQCHELIHISNIFTNNKTLELASKLVDATGYEKVFFVNSGAEANEAALKLARHVAFLDYGEDKNEIISFTNSFHGRTLFSVSVGGQHKYSDGFGPKPAAITHLPFNDIEALEKAISDKTCCVMLEPIQGEGGIITATDEFLNKARELCDKHNALLIFDEVQTGVGRTGTFYAYEQTSVKPDILTTAKGLASGMPIGAILTSTKIAAHFGPGTHGSTFGGNALACAVGSYIVTKVSDPKFLQKVLERSALLRQGLAELNDKYQIFETIRGKGLLIGCVLNEKYKGQSGKLQKCCADEKLLTLVAGANVLRLTPALNIRKSVIAKALKHLDKAFADFVKANNQ
ncbi:MAG: acetylornithine/succinyldiaminopimelate transaminase [Succinatimonas sp.]|nr:acetylornithine/succinyldiaminopimelate transaminase [Succinatimonas sp.]